MTMFGNIGQALAGFGSKLAANPEMTSIALDMIGKNLDPNNAFAGVGTLLGQGSLTDKARLEQNKKNDILMGAVLKALGGELPSQGSEGGDASPKLTPSDQPGPTKTSFGLDAQGNTVKTTVETVPQQGQGKEAVNLTDVFPLFNP